MQQFVKCFTNLKLYPLEHSHCRDSLGHFSTQLQRFLRRHEVLRLTVSHSALLTEGEIVYEAEQRSDNLAFRLYVDGLREITIRAGTTAKEAERLAIVFYKAIIDPSLDCTNLLWEADLEHIDYQALNALAEAWEQQDFLSGESLELLESMNEDVDKTAALLNEGGLSFELTDGAAEAKQSTDLSGGTIEQEEGSQYLGADEVALQAFRDDVLAWGPDRMLTQTIATALDGLAQEPKIVKPDSVAWLLKESVEIAIRSNDMESLGELLGRYHGELQLADEEEEEEVFEFVFAFLRQEETAARVVEMALNGALGGPAAFFRISTYFGDDEPRLVAGTLVAFRDTKDWRDALFERLGASVAKQPKSLEFLLETDHEEIALQCLDLARKHLTGDALERVINIAREHPQAAAQKEAHELWLAHTPKGRLSRATTLLKSAKRDERLIALKGLIELDHKAACPQLKEIITDSEFLARDPEERRAFLIALRRLGGTASVAFLQQQTKRTTRIFNRAAAKELRAMAEEELAELKKDTRRGS
ncbi:MAG: hypothetical protein JKY65_25115 [Planctomycetes bacterium]|nr:hypothetical protein [Planctomycetota bacterium]